MARGWSPLFQVKSQLRLLGGRKLQCPEGLSTRPTTSKVRESVMNIIGAKIKNCNWLDLFSGSGVMGCEALQRGANKVLAIEQNKKAARVCKSNLLLIASAQNQSSDIEVSCSGVINHLQKGYKDYLKFKKEKYLFDLVYLDPPYGSKIYPSVLRELLENNWVKKSALVICEHASSIGLDVPHPWIEEDRRIYGSSALLILSPPSTHLVDTDSMLKRRGPEWL